MILEKLNMLAFTFYQVQIVCNWGRNYIQYGLCGRFFLLFVDNMDTIDA